MALLMGDTQSSQNADTGKVINLPSRELTTAHQIQMLLGVAGSTISMVGSMLHCPEENQERIDRLGGELRTAAENVCVAALDRLQEMMSDKGRWDGSFQKEIESAFRVAHEKQMEVLETQQQAALEVLSPHFKYKPALAKMKDGIWMAYLGNLDDLDNAICGLGETPANAVDEFDKAFYGLINPEIANWLKLREDFLENGSQGNPPPFPKLNTNEPNKSNPSLESNRDSLASETPQPKHELGGNRQDSGQEQNGLPG